MHALDSGILISSQFKERGVNVTLSPSPATIERQPIRVLLRGANGSGKSAFLEAFSRLSIDSAALARKRVLLVASSYDEATRQVARVALTLEYVARQSQSQAVSAALRPTAVVNHRAVNGFDASLHAVFSRHPQITELVQRVGRCNRLAPRGDVLSAQRDPFDNAAHVNEAEVSALVQLVTKVELRRLDRIERRLTLAWRRLIEGSRLRASTAYFAPSRGESAFRLPMTGARTLTAPPAAA